MTTTTKSPAVKKINSLFHDTFYSIFIDDLSDIKRVQKENPSLLVLLSMASDIDSTTRQIAEDTKSIAEDFERMHFAVLTGTAHLSNPMNSSRVTDMPVLIGQLKTMREGFRNLFRMTQNSDCFCTFYEEIAASHTAVRDSFVGGES